MKKTINTALLYRRIFLLVYDIFAVFASSVLALLIRYEFVYDAIDKNFLNSIYSFMPFTMLITVVVFEVLRLYNSLWAFASVNELQNIVAACGVRAGADDREETRAPQLLFYVCISADCVYLCQQIQLPVLSQPETEGAEEGALLQYHGDRRRRGGKPDYPGHYQQ